MDIEQFVKQFEEQFDEVKPGTFTSDGPIGDLVEWSSMNLLLAISYIKIEFDVELTLAQLKSCSTLRDLYEAIQEQARIANE